MRHAMALWQSEPALVVAAVTGLVDALLILLTTFGLPVLADQKVAIDGLISAVLALVGLLTSGVVTRSQVVSASRIVSPPPPPPPSDASSTNRLGPY